MKPLLTYILLAIMLSAVHLRAMAQSNMADTIVSRLPQPSNLRSSFELGQLGIQAYTYGLSHCQRQGIAGRLLPHLLPFQASPSHDVAFEAFSQIEYQWPGDMHLNVSALQASQPRKARSIMRALYHALLPIYATRRHKDYGSNKSFVLPFYDEGPQRYTFQLQAMPDTLLRALSMAGLRTDTAGLCCIRFEPRRRHHTLLNGCMLVDTLSSHILGIDCEGRIDMARFRSQLLFAPDSLLEGRFIPHSSHIDIDYRYLGTRARNSYQTQFRYLSFTPFDSLDRHSISHDLTPYYTSKERNDTLDFSVLRPLDLPPSIDSLIYSSGQQAASATRKRPKRRIETFSETLVSGSSLGNENNRLRIYGPLDPASLGYDKFNGFTIHERARWRYRYANHSELFLRGELGYAFGLHEMRYRLQSDWTYRPRRRGRLHLEVRRSNSNFSSKFIQTVNDALKQKTGAVKFDSLGLDYYQRYEVTLQHSYELVNGLMLHTGILATYRNPVKHGVRRIAEMHRQELIDSYYADFAPFVRLEWTPDQYYWYDNGYKTYIHSPAPTFALEVSRAIPGVLGAESNYGRAEFDVQQSIAISRLHTLAYHVGIGKFFNQKGEYFINYRYFSRSQYPTSWEDDRVGGTFHLLNDYWYASSPSYIQAHFMQETPFGLLHLIRPISRYVIKERIYFSSLWSEGKSFYDEIGYGIDNNYFNVGLFVGFKNLEYFGLGVKFRIEIGRHL